ncbi:NapA-type sodium/hydrogen antiporter [Thermococcus kodakarensis KOD1]|uniref:NapA-type sodium/hydrogen antiporter n=1 Tax=Thermococcus kodakarensis (strain ATCC BAA-918 / JCM 12380 / KOD1) TaxID=69014 RepID=Q5JIM4_THEKO|nr:cation:proton antiporter [Thermococcus kodakarensis]WCN27505.1 cation:proton antiporter [Thermococcus kodakarensis]WCN29795.1 cation:proton antiporter [Thermococcus kodakarensis]BAD85749.1 NapA-type sodium/hydrogen antiporter [Thermococcus kodakarensis KOD1]
MEILLLIAIMLATAKVMGYLFERIGQPVVLGQIFGGLLIGIFFETNPVIAQFSNLGVLLLLFMAGLESELEEFKRVGKQSVFVAGVGVIVAFLFGFGVAYFFVPFHEAVLYGALMTPTSVSITVKVLMELRKLNTREGTTILAAAVVDDVLGILVLTVAISMIKGGSVNYSSLAEVLISVSLLLFFFLYFGPEIADRVFRYVSKIDLPESETAFALVFLIVFAYLAEHLNLASILGAYLTGLALGQIPKKKAIMEHMNVLGYSLFIPLFFVEVGMRIELSYILHAGLFAVLYTTAAIVSKVIGCGLGARLGGFDWAASLRIGVGMIPRMGVELAMLAVAMSSGVISGDALTVAILMIFTTTIITPPLLKWLYSR